MKSDLIQTAKTVILAAMIALGANYAYAVWNSPAQPPPGGNVPAPVNVGGADQVKTGGFASNTSLDAPFGFFNTIGIGTTNPAYPLDVAGEARFGADQRIWSTRAVNILGAGANQTGRLNADSLHTRGLGQGQLWIEGASIDANTTIRIGEGRAGGQNVRSVRFGNNVRANGDVRGNRLCIGGDCRSSWPAGGGGASPSMSTRSKGGREIGTVIRTISCPAGTVRTSCTGNVPIPRRHTLVTRPTGTRGCKAIATAYNTTDPINVQVIAYCMSW